MQFMIIATEFEQDLDKSKTPGTGAFQAYMGKWAQFSEAMHDAGVYVTGNVLESLKRQLASGFAMASVEFMMARLLTQKKEQLGGYVFIDVPDLEEAKMGS